MTPHSLSLTLSFSLAIQTCASRTPSSSMIRSRGAVSSATQTTNWCGNSLGSKALLNDRSLLGANASLLELRVLMRVPVFSAVSIGVIIGYIDEDNYLRVTLSTTGCGALVRRVAGLDQVIAQLPVGITSNTWVELRVTQQFSDRVRVAVLPSCDVSGDGRTLL